jgi:hypothetical protein
MKCPNGCDYTMDDIDDCGDGTSGWECAMCGCVLSEDDIPCPQGDGEPCYAIDNEWGGSECAYCGRNM